MAHETLTIEGMSCGHCVRAVEEALREIPGVDLCRVEIGLAELTYPEDTALRDRVIAAIEGAGFRVVYARAVFKSARLV